MSWVKRHKWLSTFLSSSLLLATVLGVSGVDVSVPLMAFGGLFLILWFAARKPSPVVRSTEKNTNRGWAGRHKFWLSVVVVLVTLSALGWSSVASGDFSIIAYLTGLYVIIGLVTRWLLSFRNKSKEENNAK